MAEAQRDEIAKLEALYAANPEGHVFTHLAEAYRKAGELEHARDILAEGLRRHPESASAHVVLGRVERDRADNEAARRAFARVLSLDDGNLIALRQLGELATERGDRTEALGYFRELLNRDANDPALQQAVDELGRSLELEMTPAPAPVAAPAGVGEPGPALPEDWYLQPPPGSATYPEEPAEEMPAAAAAESMAEAGAGSAEPIADAATPALSESPLAPESFELPAYEEVLEPLGEVEPWDTGEPEFLGLEFPSAEAGDVEFLSLDGETDLAEDDELEFISLDEEVLPEDGGKLLILESEAGTGRAPEASEEVVEPVLAEAAEPASEEAAPRAPGEPVPESVPPTMLAAEPEPVPEPVLAVPELQRKWWAEEDVGPGPEPQAEPPYQASETAGIAPEPEPLVTTEEVAASGPSPEPVAETRVEEEREPAAPFEQLVVEELAAHGEELAPEGTTEVPEPAVESVAEASEPVVETFAEASEPAVETFAEASEPVVETFAEAAEPAVEMAAAAAEAPVQPAAEAELVLAAVFEPPAEPIPIIDELTSLGDLLPVEEPVGPEAIAAPEVEAAGLFTETMAELYRSQGFADRAAGVYRWLLARDPENARLHALLAEVTEEAPGAADEATPAQRDWLHDVQSVESAFTGGGGAAAGGDSLYAWSGAGEEPALAGPTIKAYFRELLAWRPRPMTASPGGELLLEEVIADEPPPLAAEAPAEEPAPEELMPWDFAEPAVLSEPGAEESGLAATEPAMSAEGREPISAEVPVPMPAGEAAADPGPESNASGAEVEGEDEDLEMFRSWLQSLKK